MADERTRDGIHALQTPDRLAVREDLAGREVLVTGVTGFAGKVWTAFLLDRVPELRRLWVVARPGEAGSARERLRGILERSPCFRPLRERHGADLGPWLAERVRVLDGDCTEPHLGLDDGTIEELSGRLDALVHFAGLTDFDPDPAQALGINVHGARHVADLAARTGARLLHVSSGYVAGRVSGHVPERLDEGVTPTGEPLDLDAEMEALETIAAAGSPRGRSPLGVDDGDPDDREARKARVEQARERARARGWPNIYTYTKGLAEQLLARHEAPVHVARPTIIESAECFPFPGWNEGVNTSAPLIWLISSWFRHFPCGADNRFDVVPVDHVARGVTLILAAALSGRGEEAYHLGSSQTNPLHFDRAVELNNLAVRRDLGRPGTRPVDRWLRRFSDTVPVGDRDHPLSVPRLRRATRGVRGALERLDVRGWLPPKLYERVGETLEEHRDLAAMGLGETDRFLRRLERMLELYRPFIFDHDYVFATERVRALDAALDETEREPFGWPMEGLDWRHYWLELHYPGVQTWCLPKLYGEDVPEDGAMDPPLELDEAASGDAGEGAGATETIRAGGAEQPAAARAEAAQR